MRIFFSKRWLFIFSLISLQLSAQTQNFNHNYSQTLVMKLGISSPDGKGGSNVINDLEDALEIIKKTDEVTIGVPKIFYLVGWQYDGHDDKYPAWFEVNKALKREEDASAEESLIWLMQEARKYNTTISFHINMTDAYDNSPLWETYVQNDLISKKRNGKLKIIGKYNDRKAYQVNYKNEWESGYAQKRIDSLITMLPLKEAGTIHLDAWFARNSPGHNETEEEERIYQEKIGKYWMDHGVDVTSEFIIPYLSGLVPYAWWFNQNLKQYLDVPATVYCGGMINKNLKGDKKLGVLFGTSIHGEDIFPALRTGSKKAGWAQILLRDFCLNSVPYFFLNQHHRLSVEGKGNKRIAKYSENVEVHLADSSIWKEDVMLKKGSNLLMPISWGSALSMIAFSKNGFMNKSWQLPQDWKRLKEVALKIIPNSGEEQKTVLTVESGQITFSLKKGEAALITQN